MARGPSSACLQFVASGFLKGPGVNQKGEVDQVGQVGLGGEVGQVGPLGQVGKWVTVDTRRLYVCNPGGSTFEPHGLHF